MIDIKVSLSVELPGSTMFSKEECLKTTHKVIDKKTKAGKVYKKTIKVEVEDWDKTSEHSMKVTNRNGENPEVITFRVRKCKPATQSLNMSREAYDYMTSRECPAWEKLSKWGQMTATQRLESHIRRIVEHLGGVSYTYQVFED